MGYRPLNKCLSIAATAPGERRDVSPPVCSFQPTGGLTSSRSPQTSRSSPEPEWWTPLCKSPKLRFTPVLTAGSPLPAPADSPQVVNSAKLVQPRPWPADFPRGGNFQPVRPVSFTERREPRRPTSDRRGSRREHGGVRAVGGPVSGPPVQRRLPRPRQRRRRRRCRAGRVRERLHVAEVVQGRQRTVHLAVPHRVQHRH